MPVKKVGPDAAGRTASRSGIKNRVYQDLPLDQAGAQLGYRDSRKVLE